MCIKLSWLHLIRIIEKGPVSMGTKLMNYNIVILTIKCTYLTCNYVTEKAAILKLNKYIETKTGLCHSQVYKPCL